MSPKQDPDGKTWSRKPETITTKQEKLNKNKVNEKKIADTSGVGGREETINDYNNLSFSTQLGSSILQDYPS